MSVMVLLDRALASSYRLSIVTMLLTEAVWPQFAMQVFGFAISTPVLGGMGVIGVGGLNWLHSVAVGEPYLVLFSFSVRL